MTQINIIDSNKITSYRLDAEYYKTFYFDILKKLSKVGAIELRNFVNVKKKRFDKKCDHFSYIEISKVNLMTGEYKTQEISCKEAPNRAQYIVNSGDVLVSMVRPNRNAIAFVEGNNKLQVCSTGFCVLSSNAIPPEYLFIYLKTTFARELLSRSVTASMYPAIAKKDVLELPFFIPNEKLKQSIASKVKKALELLRKSKNLRAKAETLFLKEFNLDEFNSKNQLIYQRNLSDISEKNRLDAEYFLPKYEIIFKKIEENTKNNNWEIKTIEEISEPLRYGTSKNLTYLNKGIPFLRITDVQDFRFEKDLVVFISKETAKEVSYAVVREGDLIISRSGTLGLTIPITREFSNSIFGSYFIRIRPKIKINQKYLAFYLNSFLGKIQIERISTGAIQTNLTIPAIKSIEVIIPTLEFQKKISEFLNKSERLDEKAKQLLKQAKTKLEYFIEKK